MYSRCTVGEENTTTLSERNITRTMKEMLNIINKALALFCHWTKYFIYKVS